MFPCGGCIFTDEGAVEKITDVCGRRLTSQHIRLAPSIAVSQKVPHGMFNETKFNQ
jgi:hypothetical protein